MAIKVEIGDNQEWVTFVPEYMGNRESDDPASVEIRPLSAADTGRYGKQLYTIQRPGFRGQTTDNATEVTERMFVDNVRNPSGFYTVDAEGKERAITSSKELWHTRALQPVINEIQAALVDYAELTQGQVKNLPSPSTGRSGGKAGDA